MNMIFFSLIAIAIFLLWKLIKHFCYWTDQGVKQSKLLCTLGDSLNMLYRKESFFDMTIRLYRTFPEERYVGTFQGTLPTLLIRDPEIIKQITVKEFEHFRNHNSFVSHDIDPLWSKNLFFLKDTAWRNTRSTLSPSFTSSKMKTIFSLMVECVDVYVDYFLKKEETVEVELKDILTRYSNDVIASVIFGYKCDSINIKDNDFYEMGKKTTTLGLLRALRFSLFVIAPGFSKLIKLKFFPEEISNFFLKIVKENIHVRETQGIVRPDMINLLLEARKGNKFDEVSDIIDTGFATVQESAIHANKGVKAELTDVDIAAHALGFFFAGFDSVSSAMSFMAYELAVNPDIQRKLQQEIDDTLEECDGKITYEALMGMKYMDNVVCETFRKWPTAVGTDRICSKSFTIEPVNAREKPVHLKPGDGIFIPFSGIHRDPHYYPKPDIFDPERFSDETKGNIRPYTYMPFGLGPRNCLGSRFAILEVKTIFFYMLSKLNFIVTEKTQIPLKLSTKVLNVVGENGMWIGIEHRVR